MPTGGSGWKRRRRLNAIREIITTHNPTRGAFAESLLREVIAEFLPQRYAAATGFIMNRPQRSNQLDIIVYDQLTDSPVLRDGGFVVLTPGTARLIVEVKSELTGKAKDGDIEGALENIRSAKEVGPDVRGIIFGFDGNAIDKFTEWVKKWGAGDPPVPRNRWPDRVFNMKKRFTMTPTPGTTAGDGSLLPASTHDVYPDGTVARTFLTAALQAINGLANLRAFFPADPLGEAADTF